MLVFCRVHATAQTVSHAPDLRFETQVCPRRVVFCLSACHGAPFGVSHQGSRAVLSNASVASSTNCIHGKRPNEGCGKDVMSGTSWNDDVIATADADEVNRGGIRTADVSVTNYTTLFTDSRTLFVAPNNWFLQLESCNSRSANPHRCVGRSGLHDIHPADDPCKLMTGGEPVVARNGRNVSQIVASSRIRQIAKESGDSGINPGFRK